jgi:acetylornithine aminotransferase/acetylornithine/N-succinyldiaminopimelate aminotransferase
MLAMELNSAELAKAVVAEFLQRRILINRTNDTVLRFLPPYIIHRKHVDEVIRALDKVLSSLSERQVRLQKSTPRSRS